VLLETGKVQEEAAEAFLTDSLAVVYDLDLELVVVQITIVFLELLYVKSRPLVTGGGDRTH